MILGKLGGGGDPGSAQRAQRIWDVMKAIQRAHEEVHIKMTSLPDPKTILGGEQLKSEIDALNDRSTDLFNTFRYIMTGLGPTQMGPFGQPAPIGPYYWSIEPDEIEEFLRAAQRIVAEAAAWTRKREELEELDKTAKEYEDIWQKAKEVSRTVIRTLVHAPLPDPFGPSRVRPIPTPSRFPDPFATLSPQARDRAQIARRDQGGPPGESGPPVLPGSNPMGIPMGRSSRPRFDVGPGPRPGDTPLVAPKPKPFAPSVGPNPPTPGPDRSLDRSPNPAPQKKKGPGGSGGSAAPNPPAERSTDSKSASIESRSDPKPATETKTETPTATPAADQKAPPPTDTNSGGGTTGGGGTSTDPKDDKKSTDGTKDSKLYAPIWPFGSGMPNPEDDGSGGTGGPRANLNPEDHFGAGDDEFKLPTFGDSVFDPKLFRFRVPGALGDMPSDEGGGGSGGGIGGPRSYGGQNQNPNPEDTGGGGGGPRAYGSSSQSSSAGPRSYDAYPDPESTGGGGPRGYNERPNPEDAAGPRGPSARNRSAIGPWSASRNRML